MLFIHLTQTRGGIILSGRSASVFVLFLFPWKDSVKRQNLLRSLVGTATSGQKGQTRGTVDGSLTVCHSVKIPKDDQRQRIGSCQSHNTPQGITYESPLCSAFLSDFNSTVLCCRSSDVLGGPSYCLPGVTSRATCSVLGMIVWRNEGMTRVWGRWHSLSADLSYTEY
jgi:hypothetical protein